MTETSFQNHRVSQGVTVPQRAVSFLLSEHHEFLREAQYCAVQFAMGYYFYFEHHVLPGAVREFEHVDDFKNLITTQIEDFIKSLTLVIQ